MLLIKFSTFHLEHAKHPFPSIKPRLRTCFKCHETICRFDGVHYQSAEPMYQRVCALLRLALPNHNHKDSWLVTIKNTHYSRKIPAAAAAMHCCCLALFIWTPFRSALAVGIVRCLAERSPPPAAAAATTPLSCQVSSSVLSQHQ